MDSGYGTHRGSIIAILRLMADKNDAYAARSDAKPQWVAHQREIIEGIAAGLDGIDAAIVAMQSEAQADRNRAYKNGLAKASRSINSDEYRVEPLDPAYKEFLRFSHNRDRRELWADHQPLDKNENE